MGIKWTQTERYRDIHIWAQNGPDEDPQGRNVIVPKYGVVCICQLLSLL